MPEAAPRTTTTAPSLPQAPGVGPTPPTLTSERRLEASRAPAAPLPARRRPRPMVGNWARRIAGLAGAALALALVLAVWSASKVALESLVEEPPATELVPVTPLDAGDGPAPALVLSYAGINYMNGGPADSVIELKVIVVNSGTRHSDSTSIRWEPSFAREYTFLKSDPSPWRVRVDEWGWGVFDGPGVLPERDGTYWLWFTRTGFTVDEPRVQVIGNGNLFIGDTFAIAMNRILNREPAMQGMFERPPLSRVADRLGRAVPDAMEAAPFGFALGLAGTLTALVLAGIVAALRRPPDPPRRTPHGAALQ